MTSEQKREIAMLLLLLTLTTVVFLAGFWIGAA